MATDIRQLRAGPAAAGVSELNPFQQLLNQPMRFDAEAYHVMQQRDEQLIEDELLNGASSKAFVYDFSITGTRVTGVSVVGARQLASEYGGIKARIVATVEKRGALFIFRSFEPLNIETRTLHDLATEADYYECVMQVDDIKTGNSIQVRKSEAKTEARSQAKGGGTYERPNYSVICESKAYRNGVLAVLPQSVIQAFKAKHLAAGNSSNEQTLGQRRAGAIAFAAKHGIALDREVMQSLTMAELDGLGGAVAMGIDAFLKAGRALGLIEGEQTGEVQPPAQPPKPAAPPPPAPAQGRDPNMDGMLPTPAAKKSTEWEPTPQEKAAIEAEERAQAEREQRGRTDAVGTAAQQQSLPGEPPAPPQEGTTAVPPATRRRANAPRSME